MNIALLHIEDSIGKWFANQRPEVDQYMEVNSDLLSADVIIIVALYFINDEHYQILKLWEKYLRVWGKQEQKLIIMGWSPSDAKNFIKVGSIPPLNLEWGNKILPTKQKGNTKPTYPKLLDKDILEVLGKVLHSHGERAILKLLGIAQKKTKRIESRLSSPRQNQTEKLQKDIDETELLMKKVQGVWKERLPYFKLMPQFPKLRQVEVFFEKWQAFYRGFPSAKLALSKQIIEYNEWMINEIVDFYEFEKES